MKQRMRRISALLLVVVMCVSLVVPAFAAEEGATCPGADGIHTKSNCSYGEAIATHEAGCNKQGYTVYQCKGCDTYFAADFVESFGDHDYVTMYKEATCLEAGYTKIECANCHDVKSTTVIPSLNHSWNYDECGEAVCSRCGEAGTAPDDVHKWGEPELLKAPTHTVTGEAKLTCTDCGLTKVVVIDKVSDCVWVEYPDTPPTCEEKGLSGGKKCTICGATAKRANQTTEPFTVLNKIDCFDADEEWIYDKYATCTTPGYVYQICDMCGDECNKIRPAALGHGYQFKVLEETYEAKGKTLARFALEYELSFPAGTVDTTKTPLIVYIDGVRTEISTETAGDTLYIWNNEFVDEVSEYAWGANCGEYSYEHYNCYLCNASVTKPIEPGHKWVLDSDATFAPDCDDNGADVYVCDNPHCKGKLETDVDAADGSVVYTNREVMGVDKEGNPVVGAVAVRTEVVESLGHVYDPVVVAPTCSEFGYTYYKCVNCGADKDNGAQSNPTEKNPDGHVTEDVEVTKPTCTTPGTKNVVCTLCQAVVAENVEIPATGHAVAPHTSHIATKEIKATCTTPGYRVCVCDTCGEEVTVYWANALGHTIAVKNGDAPSCATGAAGTSEVYCTREGCGVVLVETPVEYDPTNRLHHSQFVETNRVEGDCTTPDVVTYVCGCADGFTYTTEETTTHGQGHKWVNHAAVTATCLTDGNLAWKECSVCGFVTIDGTNPAVEADYKIEKFSNTGSHLNVVDIPAVEAKCGVAGNTAGSKCEECGVWLQTVTELAAVAHDYKLLDATLYQYNKRAANCTEWGYEFHQCTKCGDEKIVKYEGDKGGHNAVEFDAVAPTCQSTGTAAGTKCSHCDKVLTGGETVSAVPHKNTAEEEFMTYADANGNLYAACTETVTDLSCVYCNTTYTKNHLIAVTNIPATCMQYSYELHVCVHCEMEEMVSNGFTYSEDHIGWSAWTIVEDATIAKDGLKKRTCVCGAVEEVVIPALPGMDVSISADNAFVAGADITNSGLVAVTLKTNTKSLGVWAIRLNVTYDPSVVTGVDAKAANEKFADIQVAYNNGVATIVAYASVDSTDTATLADEEALVVLYFRVAADATVGTALEFATANIEVITDTTAITVDDATTATAVNAQLGFVTDDAAIDLTDAYAMKQYITGEADEEYCAAADLNLDGKVSAADFGLMQKYLIGELTVEDLAVAYQG